MGQGSARYAGRVQGVLPVMSTTDKTSAQVVRALEMVEALAAEPLRGMTNKDLAAALRCPPSYVTRTADSLIAKGWAVKDDATGRFRIGRQAARVGIKVMSALEKAEHQLAETRRNFTLSD